jgi:cytoskeletal protein CcmA (bactofilin family)
MRMEKIEGIGTISGGVYDEISIEGVGNFKGDIKAVRIDVEGVLNSYGMIEADEFNCEGVSKLTKSLRVKHLRIEGTLKQEKDKIEADDIHCEGTLTSYDEISADNIVVEGLISAPELYGEHIKINHNGCFVSSDIVPNIFRFLHNSTFGKTYSNVDLMEATTIDICGVNAKSVRGNIITIGPNCRIDEVDCNGTLRIHPGAIVRKISGVSPISW